MFACALTVFLVSSSGAAPLKLGDEVLAEDGFKPLHGKRVGLLTNPSGVNRNLETTIDVLRSARGVKLVALFGPEHGIYGSEFACTNIESSVDQRTGLQVYSLYGTNHGPSAEMLKGIDA